MNLNIDWTLLISLAVAFFLAWLIGVVGGTFWQLMYLTIIVVGFGLRILILLAFIIKQLEKLVVP